MSAPVATLQLLWVSLLLSGVVGTSLSSRAALGRAAGEVSLEVLAWGALVLAAWLQHRRARARGGAERGTWLLVGAVILLGTALGARHAGRNHGLEQIGALSLLPFAALLLCPLVAALADALRAPLRDGPPTRPDGAPPVRRVLLACAPLLGIPALGFGLLALGAWGAGMPAELAGALEPDGLAGVLFAELAVYGPGAAVLVGLGLDRLDGSREGWLSRVLGALAVLALLLAAAFVPWESPALELMRRTDDGVVRERLPLDLLRHLVPLALLALGLLLRRDLGLAAAGFRGTPLAWQLALVLLVLAGTALLTAPLGAWVPPATLAAGCALCLLARPRRVEGEAPAAAA